jgi:hypothetical protein
MFFAQNPASDEPSLDVAADAEPREEIRILKNQAAFLAWAGDRVRADQKFSRIGRIQARNKAKERGFAAPTWTNQTN